MAGLAPHGDHKEPVSRRARVFQNTFYRVGSHVSGCLKSECRYALRKIEIVVDGLRDVDHAQPSLCCAFQAEGGKTGVISSNGNQSRHAELLQTFQSLGE